MMDSTTSSYYDANITVSELEGNLQFNDDDFNTSPKKVFDPRDIIQMASNTTNNQKSLLNDSLTMNSFTNNVDTYLMPYGKISSTPASSNVFTLPNIAVLRNNSVDATIVDQPNITKVSSAHAPTLPDDLLNLISLIPALQSTCSAMSEKIASLESTCTNLHAQCADLQSKNEDLQGKHTTLQNEFADYRKSNEVRWNNGEQYTRKNSLLLHRVKNVPTRVNGTKFSMFVARTLSKLFPKFPLSHHDIDTSHILYYEFEGDFRWPVIVVKFVNRDLRNDIRDDFILRDFSHSSFRITEHLTSENRSLLNTATNSCDEAWSDQGKLYASIKGKTVPFSKVDDLVCTDTAEEPEVPATSNEYSGVPFSRRLRFFRYRRNPRDSRPPYNNQPSYGNGNYSKKPPPKYKRPYQQNTFHGHSNRSYANHNRNAPNPPNLNRYQNNANQTGTAPPNSWPILPHPGISPRQHPFPPPPPVLMNQGNPVFFRLPPSGF